MATIAALYRYSVKSLAGEALEAAQLDLPGLAGDRRYAFVDSAPQRAGRVLTARQLWELLTYSAQVEGDRVTVTTPGGGRLDADSEQLRSEIEGRLGRSLTLREAPGSNFDDSPLLLLNLESVRRLAELVGRDLDPRRFRANLLLEDLPADAEQGWVGRRLGAGSAVLEGALMCERCVMITCDPETLEKDPAILRRLAASGPALMGLYCRVLEPGRVAVGDSVEPL